MNGNNTQALASMALLRRFEAEHGLQLEGLDAMAAQVQVRELKPREAAFREGDACPCVHMVRSGLLKQVYTRADGSEWIKSFSAEGQLFACPRALRGERTSFASVAIEACVVERIDFRLLEQAAEASAAWQKALRIAFQRLAELKVQRELELLTLNARALYARFAAREPALLARIAQKDLAAFIGVTAVGLNRIVAQSKKQGHRHLGQSRIPR